VKIKRLKLRNFKSYFDSGDIELSSKFTVIVGKNNSGKSALLQGLRFRNAGAKPHRSSRFDRDVALDPAPKFDADIVFNWSEMERIAGMTGISRILFPVERDETRIVQDFQRNWRNLIGDSKVTVSLTWSTDNQKPTPAFWPAHGRFQDPQPNGGTRNSMSIEFHAPSREWRFGGIVGNEDNLMDLTAAALDLCVFVFDAERLNIDISSPAHGQRLHSNASNLPTLLHEMQANPDLWNRFTHHVKEVFPQITAITTPPAQDAPNQLTICLWQVETSTMRDDLAIRLKEAGTGVGQVLAILYIAMTRRGSVIAIDEPNSFLHPGAARKLVEILHNYTENQYVISTHSADLISAIQPEVLHQVVWDPATGESRVRRIDQSNMGDLTELLSDLGVRLSDVFGADQIVWVEGQTEAACFPILAACCDHAPPPGTIFVPVRATGDFDAKSSDATQVWEIYRRLTKGAALIPPSVAFSFDRESRTARQISELEAVSGGKVSFLPRRLLENYFLHAGAIQNAIAQEYELRLIEGTPPTVEELSAEIGVIANIDPLRNTDLEWICDVSWTVECHGARLLQDLFAKYNLTYAKIRHGAQITKWLLENDPDHLTELKSYIASLWGVQS